MPYHQANKRIDRPALLLGLLGAACGPGDSQTTLSATTTTGVDTEPVEPGTTIPTEPTAATPTESTSTSTSTTEPVGTTDGLETGIECLSHKDCGYDHCVYCVDNRCVSERCCSSGGYVQPVADCYYDCYSDDDCGYGSECSGGLCDSIPASSLQPCDPAAVIDLTQWNLGQAPSAFALADLDADGDLDLAAAQPGIAQVEVALNDGAGNFAVASAAAVGTPLERLSLAAGDLDGDGDIDLAVARQEQPGGLVLLFGEDAVFTPGPLLPGFGPLHGPVHIGDVDGDGAEDLVTTYPEEFRIGVRRGDGEGGFTGESEGFGVKLRAGHLLDVTEDGIADMIGSKVFGDSGQIGVWGGEADATFGQLALLDVESEVSVVRAADLTLTDNRSSAPDLVHTHGVPGGVSVWDSLEVNVWTGSPRRFVTSVPLQGGVLAAMEPPAGPDLVAATGLDRVMLLPGDDAGGFTCEHLLTVDNPSDGDLIAVGDVDGDGTPDILVGSPGLKVVQVLHR